MRKVRKVNSLHPHDKFAPSGGRNLHCIFILLLLSVLNSCCFDRQTHAASASQCRAASKASAVVLELNLFFVIKAEGCSRPNGAVN